MGWVWGGWIDVWGIEVVEILGKLKDIVNLYLK
jgi:hypothetical protein